MARSLTADDATKVATEFLDANGTQYGCHFSTVRFEHDGEHYYVVTFEYPDMDKYEYVAPSEFSVSVPADGQPPFLMGGI